MPPATSPASSKSFTQAELRRQSEALPPSQPRAQALSRLAALESRVVVTGQQVGLFLGPALGVYKAATAIALARRASHSRHTVAVFWLQSEDHDADEVRGLNLLDADHDLKTVALDPSGSPRTSLAERRLGPGVVAALDELWRALDGAPHRDEAIDMLRSQYRPEATWSGAYAGTLAELFAEEGLLTFDPRTLPVARELSFVHRRAFEQVDSIAVALREGAEELERQGRPVVVKPRPDCSLSFVHVGDSSGPRYRLQRTAQGWKVPAGDATLTTEQLSKWLEHDPLRFSTSALLRVVAQQWLFPETTQVVGPTEGVYLQQVPPLLKLFGCPSPELLPRVRCVVTDQRVRRRLQRLGLGASDFDGSERVLRRLADRDSGLHGADAAASLTAAVERELERLKGELLKTEPRLERAIARTRRHVAKGARALGSRLDAARARRDHDRTETVKRVADVLTPAGQPQERTLGSIYFIARFGRARFKAALLEAADQHVSDYQDHGATRAQELAL